MEVCFVVTYASTQFGIDDRDEIEASARRSLESVVPGRVGACTARNGHVLFSILVDGGTRADFQRCADAVELLRI